MTIKKKLIGATIFKKGIGKFTIEEGKEELYKKLGLDIFEDDTNKRTNDKQRTANSKRKDKSK